MVKNQLMPSYILIVKALNAFLKVLHHLFATLKYKNLAHSDSTIPLTRRQTISQPYIVALVTQIKELEKIVLPFFGSFLSKHLSVLIKKQNGTLDEKFIAKLRFVPTMDEVLK